MTLANDNTEQAERFDTSNGATGKRSSLPDFEQCLACGCASGFDPLHVAFEQHFSDDDFLPGRADEGWAISNTVILAWICFAAAGVSFNLSTMRGCRGIAPISEERSQRGRIRIELAVGIIGE